MLRRFVIAALIAVLLLAAATTTTHATTETKQQEEAAVQKRPPLLDHEKQFLKNYHQQSTTTTGSTDLKNVVCSANNSIPDWLCLRDPCWWEQPFYCYRSDGSTLCLSPSQAEHPTFFQCQSCFDTRKCGTTHCKQQCSESFCKEAISQGKHCGGADKFICEKGQVQWWCGQNEKCNNAQCFVNRTDCGACCDFESCGKHMSCRDVPCSREICQGRYQCDIYAPYMCPETFGCAAEPNYWPKKHCTNCCDFRTCYFKCSECPPEMCQDPLQYDCPMTQPYMCTDAVAPEFVGQCAANKYQWGASNVCLSCCTCFNNKKK